MPMLEYVCPQCGKKFEELVKSHEEEVLCPECGAKAERCWCGTVYSATGKPVKKC
ncbi:MAG: zinc ribbon domain-containing protein, partial [Clostridiales bacterium]|nr:zinc ribbon domain-containing protein [Clostridiales bacterium]